MKIYGAGSLEDVKLSVELGSEVILTNPQGFDVYYKGQMTLEEITKALCKTAKGKKVFIQIHGKDSESIVERGIALHKISPEQVGFKIVANEKGFWAIKKLQEMGIDCIATTLFSLSQASIAATVGAWGICPFVSRAEVIQMDLYQIISDIKKQYAKLDKAPQIIAVSLKSVSDCNKALAAGCDALGLRYPLIKQMMEHPLSDRAEVLFAKNWKNVKGEDISYMDYALSIEGIAE